MKIILKERYMHKIQNILKDIKKLTGQRLTRQAIEWHMSNRKVAGLIVGRDYIRHPKLILFTSAGRKRLMKYYLTKSK